MKLQIEGFGRLALNTMKGNMKILIGYDGSHCAEAAIDDLQRAGLPPVAEAFVLSVTEVSLPSPPPSAYEIVEQAREVHVPADMSRVYAKGSPAMQEAQSLCDKALERMLANFPGWRITGGVSVGSPARELVNKADQWKPDLIVVGSHGRLGMGRLVLGSVSQGVVTYAHCSVRVARGRLDEPDTPVRIVIGVDGSPSAAAAVREIESRSWPTKSEVKLIAVEDPLSPSFVGRFIPAVTKIVEESNQYDREWLNEALKNSAECLRKCGLKVVTEIRKGDPKRVLVDAAKDWGADCIFIGSLGFGSPFERFLLGSVSASVAARAHCSVEVVRPQKSDGGNHDECKSE